MKASKKIKFVAMLQIIALEIEDKGLGGIDIEAGEMAYILRKAARLIEESNVPDNLGEPK